MATISSVITCCPGCGRELLPESNWSQVNFCRALTLMPWIKDHSGLSAWELSKASGFAYSQVSKAVVKLRDLELVMAEPEAREAGGYRYRYYPLDNHVDQVARLEGLSHIKEKRDEATYG
jgi:DNA-binding transcriptional ArsR family regulator